MSRTSTPDESLDNLWEEIWVSLAQGANSAGNSFGTPVLSTGEKDRIDSRIVILRKVYKEKRVLMCHSDVRAKKVQQFTLSPAGSWLFWDPSQRIQVRMTTVSSIHHLDQVAKDAWQELSPSSKTNYSVSLHPGEKIDSPDIGFSAYDRSMTPDPETEARWFQNFVVLASTVQQAEWLCLSRAGHRRAKFIVSESGVEKFWIVP